ncbi:putative malate dehydrogenase 1B [Cydia fagiglandana]|uniref:putative malate dehydrogenase 1B n=1 Tax=Cydia fagiglandana TaxID=1458189 RepID=UPI002FEE5BA1
MVVRIIIAGESQCEKFAQLNLVVDHLSQNLPQFCYERIEKSIPEWKTWLLKINQKYKWHHIGSPLVWKELLMKGSKPYYIGGLPEFLDYCHSYYQFDYFMADSKFKGITENCNQYRTKIKKDNQEIQLKLSTEQKVTKTESLPKNDYVVCISGAGFQLTEHLISQLLELSVGTKTIAKIFIYDSECPNPPIDKIEHECSYIETNYSGKVVKYVEKIGIALTYCDLLIVLDHVPFHMDLPIGDWLEANKHAMEEIALMLNASAKRNIRILLPNLGPACYNATILMKAANIEKHNIVVATSDLGLEVAPVAAEIAEVAMRNMFCPPVWGFVGVNHLVDIRNTIHKYNTFEPYQRYTRVRNSTLNIGSITPEMRTMEYLMIFDNSLWTKVLERRKQANFSQLPINKVISLVNVVKLWLFGAQPDEIICLGIKCNGSFGLQFDGAFSQPAHYVNGKWLPADNYLMPKDPEMKLPYLEDMARLCMNMQQGTLPKVESYTPCICKRLKLSPKVIRSTRFYK